MATATLSPYLVFDGNAKEAMTFYKSVLGGELTVTTFGEMNTPDTPAALKDKVMHAALDNGALTLMASDSAPGAPHTPGNSVTLALTGTDAARLKGFWDGLSAGGQIQVPLGKQAWGDEYGSVVDKFGMTWQVNIGAE